MFLLMVSDLKGRDALVALDSASRILGNCKFASCQAIVVTTKACDAIIEIEKNNIRLQHYRSESTAVVLQVSGSIGTVTALAKECLPGSWLLDICNCTM